MPTSRITSNLILFFAILSTFCSLVSAQATDPVGNIECIAPPPTDPLCTLRVSGSDGSTGYGYWDLDMFDANCIVIGHDSVNGNNSKYSDML